MRNLLKRGYESLGLDQKIWAALETGDYGDNATGGLVPVGTDAKEVLSANTTWNIPREDSAARSGRSVVTRHSGKKTVEWNVESYIVPGIPVGNAPVLPPMHEMILSAFGECDETNPAKKVYKLSSIADKSFRMLEENTHYSRLAVGCVADELTFSLPGDGKASFKAAGFAQDVYMAGMSTLAQALTGLAQKANLVVQDLTFEADVAGSAGNDISITYVGGAVLGVVVTGSAIVVTLETGVSDADAVKAAIEAVPAAASLVNITVTGTGTDVQVAAPIAHLSGGLGANQFKVQPGEGIKFDVGSYVDTILASDGNTTPNSAKLVTAKGTGQNADVVTVGTSLVAAPLGSFVIGHAPATFEPVSSENALVGLKGSVNIAGYGALNCQVISAEVGLKNNYTQKNFSFGKSKICGYIADKRRAVSLKLELILNSDNQLIYMRNKQFVAEDVEILLQPQDIPAPAFTTTVGRTYKFNLPKVEFNVPPLEAPADSYMRLVLEGVALATDINTVDNEVTLTIE